MVKDGKEHAVKDAGPEGQREGGAMELEGVKQHFQSAVSDVGAGVECQLRQASQQREPEVHVLILVTELQALHRITYKVTLIFLLMIPMQQVS